jgi:hypothetical protein
LEEAMQRPVAALRGRILGNELELHLHQVMQESRGMQGF